jgi:hypothetical protein
VLIRSTRGRTGCQYCVIIIIIIVIIIIIIVHPCLELQLLLLMELGLPIAKWQYLSLNTMDAQFKLKTTTIRWYDFGTTKIPLRN